MHPDKHEKAKSAERPYTSYPKLPSHVMTGQKGAYLIVHLPSRPVGSKENMTAAHLAIFTIFVYWGYTVRVSLFTLLRTTLVHYYSQ